MAKLKSYVSKGKPHYTITKRKDELDAIINKLAEKNPSFAANFMPATNSAEFERLYTKYAVENAEFTDIPTIVNDKEDLDNDGKDIEIEKEDPDGDKQKGDDYYNDTTTATDEYNFDELPSKQAIVRDYVMDETSNDNSDSNKQAPKTTFDEPQTWGDKFIIPNEEAQTIFEEDNE